MMNSEFQKLIKKGDKFVTTEGSIRHEPGITYTFIGFIYCKSIDNCKGCKGLIFYEQPDRDWNGSDCMREYADNNVYSPLVMMVDIIDTIWFDEKDFEL